MLKNWILYFILVSCFQAVFAVNLQVSDTRFFSTHQFPYLVTNSSRMAFVATESGILVFDYGKNTWTDLIHCPYNIHKIFYAEAKQKIRVQDGTQVYEYNFLLRSWSKGDSLFYGNENPEAPEELGTDIIFLNNSWVQVGREIRDPWFNRYPLNQALILPTDHLWLLSRGAGAFFGSDRSKRARAIPFGLNNPICLSILSDDKNVYFGSERTNAPLIRADSRLENWKNWPSQIKASFPNGRIHAMTKWKGFLWLGTENGLVRLDEEHNEFYSFNKNDGLPGMKIRTLQANKDELFVGTDEGLCVSGIMPNEFKPIVIPNRPFMSILSLACEGDSALWVGGEYGLYRIGDLQGLRNGQSPSINQPGESYQSSGFQIRDVKFHQGHVYWLQGNWIWTLEKNLSGFFERKRVFERANPFQIQVSNKWLWVSHDRGVSVRNQETGMWADFNLSDGILGSKIETFIVDLKYIWVATDKGITRISFRSYLP